MTDQPDKKTADEGLHFTGGEGEVRMTVRITNKQTGKDEEHVLVGRVKHT